MRFFDMCMTILFFSCCFGCHSKERKVNYYRDVQTIHSLNPAFIYIHVSSLLPRSLTNETRLEHAREERDNKEKEIVKKQLIVKK